MPGWPPSRNPAENKNARKARYAARPLIPAAGEGPRVVPVLRGANRLFTVLPLPFVTDIPAGPRRVFTTGICSRRRGRTLRYRGTTQQESQMRCQEGMDSFYFMTEPDKLVACRYGQSCRDDIEKRPENGPAGTLPVPGRQRRPAGVPSRGIQDDCRIERREYNTHYGLLKNGYPDGIGLGRVGALIVFLNIEQGRHHRIQEIQDSGIRYEYETILWNFPDHMIQPSMIDRNRKRMALASKTSITVPTLSNSASDRSNKRKKQGTGQSAPRRDLRPAVSSCKRAIRNQSA